MLYLDGDLDYYTTKDLLNEVREQLTTRPRHLHLNCAALTFCDTSGISALLEVRRQATTVGTEATLRDLSPRLVRTLQISGLLDYLAGTSQPNTHRSAPGLP